MGRRWDREAAHQREVCELLTRSGPATPDPEPQFLYLTTTGRRTGLAREIEIWFTTPSRGGTDERFYVIAEHGEDAAWVRNVRANPAVAVRVGDRRFAARARVVNARTEPELWRDVRARSEAKYGWGDGLIVELTPDVRAD